MKETHWSLNASSFHISLTSVGHVNLAQLQGRLGNNKQRYLLSPDCLYHTFQELWSEINTRIVHQHQAGLGWFLTCNCRNWAKNPPFQSEYDSSYSQLPLPCLAFSFSYSTYHHLAYSITYLFSKLFIVHLYLLQCKLPRDLCFAHCYMPSS